MAKKIKYKKGGIVDEKGIMNIIKPKGNPYTENVATTIYKDYDGSASGKKKYYDIPAKARKENINEIVTESLKQNVNPYLALSISDDETTIGQFGNEIYGMNGNNTALFHTNPDKPKIPELAGRSEARGHLGVKAVKASVDYGKGRQRAGIVPKGEAFTYQAFQGYGHLSKDNAELQGVMRGKPIPSSGIDFKKTPYTGQRLLDKVNTFRNTDEYKNAVDSLTLEHLKRPIVTKDLTLKTGGIIRKKYPTGGEIDNPGGSEEDIESEANWGQGVSTTGDVLMGAAGIAAATGVGLPIAAGLAVVGGIAKFAGNYMTNDAAKSSTQNQVAAQNRITTKNQQLAMDNSLKDQSIQQRNFANNAPISSMYAKQGGTFKRPKFGNGGEGIKPLATDMSVAQGATHEETNSIDGGTGIPLGNVEIEGGGKIGNKDGEVVKNEGDSNFIFSDNLKVDGKQTFAEVANRYAMRKGGLERKSGKIAFGIDGKRITLQNAPSVLYSNTKLREVDRDKTKQLKIDLQIQATDVAIEELKQSQIQLGIAKGIYNEDGTPKEQGQEQQINPEQPMAKNGGMFPRQQFRNGTGKAIKTSGITKDEFMSELLRIEKSNNTEEQKSILRDNLITHKTDRTGYDANKSFGKQMGVDVNKTINQNIKNGDIEESKSIVSKPQSVLQNNFDGVSDMDSELGDSTPISYPTTTINHFKTKQLSINDNLDYIANPSVLAVGREKGTFGNLKKLENTNRQPILTSSEDYIAAHPIDPTFGNTNAIKQIAKVNQVPVSQQVPKVNSELMVAPRALINTSNTTTPITETKSFAEAASEIKGTGNAKAPSKVNATGAAVQGINLLADAGTATMNYYANKAIAKETAKLITPSFVPTVAMDIKAPSNAKAIQSVERQRISADKFAKDNFASPQVAAIMMQGNKNKASDELERLYGQQSNAEIAAQNANVQNRQNVSQYNNQGFQNAEQAALNKRYKDIANMQNVNSALASDSRAIVDKAQQYYKDEQTLNLYKEMNPAGVNATLEQAMKTKLFKTKNGGKVKVKNGGVIKSKYSHLVK